MPPRYTKSQKIAICAIVLPIVLSVVAAIAIWMVCVYSQLAVIAFELGSLKVEIARLNDRVEAVGESYDQLWQKFALHDKKIETLDVRVGHLEKGQEGREGRQPP